MDLFLSFAVLLGFVAELVPFGWVMRTLRGDDPLGSEDRDTAADRLRQHHF